MLIFDGFSSVEVDKYIYEIDSESVVICLYVDDMIVFGTNLILCTKRYSVASKFDMKDMGETSVSLDVKIIRKCDNIILLQEQHV